MTVEFEHVTEIDAPLDAPVDAVFDLSLDIDAHLASMADSGERAIEGVTGGQIGLGEQVTWRATHFGIPFTMTSRITDSSGRRDSWMSRSRVRSADSDTCTSSEKLVLER